MSQAERLHVLLKLLSFHVVSAFNTFWGKQNLNFGPQHGQRMLQITKYPVRIRNSEAMFLPLIILCMIIYINLLREFFVVPIHLSSKPYHFLLFSEYAIILFPSFFNLHMSSDLVIPQLSRKIPGFVSHLHFSSTLLTFSK